MLVVALYYLAFVAGHSLDQQRQLFAVWRSRGWSSFGIWRLLMLEFLLLAAVAIPAGLLAAWMLAFSVTRAVYGPGVTVPPGWRPARRGRSWLSSWSRSRFWPTALSSLPGVSFCRSGGKPRGQRPGLGGSGDTSTWRWHCSASRFCCKP